MDLIFNKNARIILIVFFILYLHPFTLFAEQRQFTKEEKVWITNACGVAAITTWGIVHWDYFSSSPQTSSEGWFSDNTDSGGADKLGHFFFSYSLSHLLTGLYTNFGYSKNKGALLGSISSAGMTTIMEIGDSFSDLGFSYEDLLMNLAGCATGYLLSVRPDLAQKIDFRLEYRPNFDQSDFTTDYENLKFLMAIKFDGFKRISNEFLKFLELHLGYYTRGYDDRISRERNLYLGIGLNISRIFKKRSRPRISKAFNYIQVPYTYLEMHRDLNQ